MDFIALFLKMAKNQFLDHQNSVKSYKTDKIPSNTVDFFNELEILCYDLSKIAISDSFLRNKYLKCYVSASILIRSFEIMVDQILYDI